MAKNNGSKSWADKQVFTTGEAAEVCKVSQQTIIRCFDSGRLQGFRVPGSKFRRIPRAELLRFMKANDIPTEILESSEPSGSSSSTTTRRSSTCSWTSSVATSGSTSRPRPRPATTPGLLTEQFRPHLVLLDYMLPDVNGNLVCERIKANPELKDTCIFIVSGVVNQDEIEALRGSGADDFFQKPFNIEELVDRMARTLDV